MAKSATERESERGAKSKALLASKPATFFEAGKQYKLSKLREALQVGT